MLEITGKSNWNAFLKMYVEQKFCSISIKPSWKMFYVDINLWTHNQSSFVAVLVLIPAPNQTTGELEPHSTSSHIDDKAVVTTIT